jgi:hypothetical protein
MALSTDNRSIPIKNMLCFQTELIGLEIHRSSNIFSVMHICQDFILADLYAVAKKMLRVMNIKACIIKFFSLGIFFWLLTKGFN